MNKLAYMVCFIFFANPLLAATECLNLLNDPTFRPSKSTLQNIKDQVLTPVFWARQAISNGKMIYHVFDTFKLRPITGGAISLDHPWVTGVDPNTKDYIWLSNIIYKTKSRGDFKFNDEQMVTNTGKYLSAMVRQSARTDRYPEGMPSGLRRMPHGLNYIHGSSHYNSGWIIFNNLEEAFLHFSNQDFLNDLKNFANESKREVILLFRETNYDPREYGKFSGYLRTILPWYSNVNGPQKQVHWGNSFPVPVVNMINGNFTNDLKALRLGDVDSIVRPAVDENYFSNEYVSGVRSRPSFSDLIFDYAIELRVKARGKKGNSFFVDSKKLQNDKLKWKSIKGSKATPNARVEEFYGSYINISTLKEEQINVESVVSLPESFDPRFDIIYALKSDGTGHSYILADGVELHASVAFRNRTYTQNRPRPEHLKSTAFIVLKDLPDESVRSVGREIRDLRGTKTLSCVVGNCRALSNGAKLELTKGHLNLSLPIDAFKKLILEDLRLGSTGEKVNVELYKSGDLSLEELLEMQKKQDYKMKVAYPFAYLFGFLKNRIFDDEEYIYRVKD